MSTNIGGTDVHSEQRAKADMFESLIARAERTRKEQGKATRQEVEFYAQAIDVCDEIKNRYHNSPNVVAKWEALRKECELRGKEVLAELGIRTDPPAKAPGAAATGKTGEATKKSEAAQNKQPASQQPVSGKTKSGFVTKNACKEVPAETIESWYNEKPKHGLEELSGMDDLVEKLMIIAGDMGFTQTDALLKIAPEKGILLYGFHGNGKTHTIEAFANYLMTKNEDMKFIQLKGSEIHASLVGVAEKTVAAAFNEAIDNAPAILFFDELDNICVPRSDAKEGHEKRLTNAFLESYNDLVNAKVPVIVFAATNNPWIVDSAAMNRFSNKLLVPLPSEEARKKFLMDRFGKLKLQDDISFEAMAEDTDNFDFRDLKNFANGLASKLKQDAKKTIANKDLPVAEQDALAEAALKDGTVSITKERYDTVRPMYHASVTEEERRMLKEYQEGLGKG